tara:strand:- start:5313 stop:6542 length:1230 start_codon:yes stop_codon:yes gene_type:complete
MRFALTFTLARSLNSDQFGVYSWAVNAFGIIGIITNFGLDLFLIRKIPEYRNTFEGKVGSVIQHTKKQVNINAFLLISIILPISYFSTYFYEGASVYNSELMIIILALPFAAYLTIFSTSLRAYDFPLHAQFIESILQTGTLLLVVLLSFTIFDSLIPQSIRTLHLVSIFVFSWILSCIIANIVFRNKIKLQAYLEPSKNAIKGWRKDQATIVIGILGWSFLGRSDVFLLAFLVPPSEVGGYFICLRLAELLMFFATVSYYVWGGKISNLIQEGNLEQAQNALKKSSQLCFFPSFILTYLAWNFAEEILFFINESFVENVFLFKVSLLVFFLKGATGMVAPMYYILGQQAFLAKLQWLLGLFFTALVLLLVPIYGVVSCLFSLAFCEAVYVITIVSRLKMKQNFSISPI